MNIIANNLCKNFNNTKALKNLNFHIKKAIITGLVGADGAGKSTLIRLIAGLLAPSSGSLEVLGYKMPKIDNLFLQNIGYMPQKFGLYEDLTCKENLNLYANLQDIKEPKKRINELLKWSALDNFKSSLAKNLSGGMKQKLALSCALIKKPKLLLLDEPGVGVDPISRIELWEMVNSLLNEDMSIIWATSYLEEAQNCKEVLLLNEGDLLFFDNPKIALNTLKNRIFLASSNLDKKELVSKILSFDEVLDAYILGQDVRFCLKNNQINLNKFQKIDKNIKIQQTNPSFEDFFLDTIKAKTKFEINLDFSVQDYQKSPIEAINLTKKYGNFCATDNISFRVKKGEIFGLLGPNGAGKSTTFKMLCGLISPTSGKALVLDESLNNSKNKSKIGYMAQKFSLYEGLSIKENLNFYAGIYGLSKKEKQARINSLIQSFKLEKYENILAQELPLGIKQKLALSCAIIHKPIVLFLDEPTSGVDPSTRREFWSYINTMVKNTTSVMITTHLMDEAEYCDRILLIYKSKQIALGTPKELKEKISDKNISMQDAFISLVKKYDDENKIN